MIKSCGTGSEQWLHQITDQERACLRERLSFSKHGFCILANRMEVLTPGSAGFLCSSLFFPFLSLSVLLWFNSSKICSLLHLVTSGSHHETFYMLCFLRTVYVCGPLTFTSNSNVYKTMLKLSILI